SRTVARGFVRCPQPTDATRIGGGEDRMTRWRFLSIGLVAILIGSAGNAARAERVTGEGPDPIRYTVTFPAPAKHTAQVEPVFPTANEPSIELYMPVWSPGFYRVEDYAKNIDGLEARTPDAMKLDVAQTRKNRWRINCGGGARVVVTYRLKCEGRSVT